MTANTQHARTLVLVLLVRIVNLRNELVSHYVSVLFRMRLELRKNPGHPTRYRAPGSNRPSVLLAARLQESSNANYPERENDKAQNAHARGKCLKLQTRSQGAEPVHASNRPPEYFFSKPERYGTKTLKHGEGAKGTQMYKDHCSANFRLRFAGCRILSAKFFREMRSTEN